MSFDLSRDSFRPGRDYALVVQQQGRVQLDADLNEAGAIHDRRLRITDIDVALRAFYPAAQPDSFRIAAGPGGLTIGPGRYHVDGLVAENRGDGDPAWDATLEQLVGTEPIPLAAQPYLPEPPEPDADRPMLAYLDVWRRSVTHVAAPDLVEAAVGVDSAARLQTVWQVRLLPLGANSTSCALAGEDEAWTALTRPPAARLTNGVSVHLPDPNPCRPPASTGYRGQENQLYRVEIHEGGTQNSATFKWSRENASVVAAVHAIDGARTRLTLDSLGRDDRLSFHDGDWIEVTDEHRILAGEPGQMARIATAGGIDTATRTVTLAAPLPAGAFPTDAAGAPDPARATRIIRWDQSGPVLRADGAPFHDLDAAGADGAIPMPPAGVHVGLENGVTVAFRLEGAGGRYRAGDWWIFAARAATAAIEPLAESPPMGVHHHYASLAVIAPGGAIEDCRQRWPRGEGDCACTIVVPAGFDLAGLPALLPPDRQVHVCLSAGEFFVDDAVTLSGGTSDGRGNLKLSGAGWATRIVTRDEAALILRDWESVDVHDLAITTGVDYIRRSEGVGILGGLTIRDTAEVRVRNLRSDGAGGVDGQEAACLRVFGGPNAGGAPGLQSVRVEGCLLLAGPDATGIHVTDARQTEISGNEVRPSEQAPDQPTRRGRQRRPARSEVPGPAAVGILVAGSFAREVRIHGNSVAGARSGIRVGLSHDAPPGVRDIADRIAITANRLDIRMLREEAAGQEGIFVGNTDSLVVRDNAIAPAAGGQEGIPIPHGIQIAGAVGRMAIVRSNHMAGCRVGVQLQAVDPPPDPLWVIADNLAEGAASAVEAPAVARLDNNLV